MVNVQRKRGETFESFLRRFNRRLMGSGRLLQARKIQFYKPAETKREKRVSALRRKGKREEYEYLKKIGRMTEEDDNRRKRPRR